MKCLFTALEENMFDTASTSPYPQVFLRPRETVHIPFKFQTFRADQSVPEQVKTVLILMVYGVLYSDNILTFVKWNGNLDKVKMNEETFSSRILGKRFSEFPQRESNPWPSRIPVGRSNHWAMGDSTTRGRLPLGELEKSFSRYSTWERFFIHFHFIQVAIPLNIYPHLSFRHIEPCRYGRTCVTHKNLVYDLAHHESPIAQWLERPTGILEGHGFNSRWGNSENLFPSILLENASSFNILTLLGKIKFNQYLFPSTGSFSPAQTADTDLSKDKHFRGK